MNVTWSGRLRRLRNAGARALFVVIALVVLRVGWHLVMRDDARALIEGRAETEVVARRDYLAAHVDDAAHALAPHDTQFAGEWSIVTLAMTALAAANIGFEYSSTVPADLELIARCATLARAKEARAFDAARWGDDPIDAMEGPHGHAGYLGELALVLEAYRALGGRDAELLALEARVIAALDDKLRHAPSKLVPSYPGESYVADNAVLLAALALSDLGRGARASGAATTAKALHAKLLSETLATWRASFVDAATGVLVFGDGTRRAARASGGAMSAMMLGYVDEVFASEQAKALAAHFDDRVFGVFSAVCELPGCVGSGDVDSGPLVRGASPSASGFAIALAKRAGDEARLDRLLATAEWAGLSLSWGGKKRYVLAPLVGDAIVLAAKSARAWDVRYL
jgi:hypothetical protein